MLRAVAEGAYDFCEKPVDLAVLRTIIDRALRLRELEDENLRLALLPRNSPIPDIITADEGMLKICRTVERLAQVSVPVLLLGESGTGKEAMARALHEMGPRARGSFVAINCAAIPEPLLESELFGHERGAFTGAQAQRRGRFEQAEGGALFLDEIGDMPAEAQTRLLRALQSGRIRRVGGRQEIAVNVRIVAATNRDLAPMIAAGTFREDLFYRLNVVPIELPPLRERREDVGALAQHFLVLAAEDGLPRRYLTPDAIARLEQRSWRGNVRELRNVVYRLALMAREERIDADTLVDLIGEEVLPSGQAARVGSEGFASALAAWLANEVPPSGTVYHRALAAFEKPLIEHALGRTGGNQLRAAQLLGINRNTLRKRIGELGLEPDRFSGTS
jgi:two-component system nitrogen regulation response regulator GlnG